MRLVRSSSGWAPGRNPFLVTPSHGTLANEAMAALTVQVHYDNPEGHQDRRDSSGLRVYYVRKARQHKIGMDSRGISPFL